MLCVVASGALGAWVRWVVALAYKAVTVRGLRNEAMQTRIGTTMMVALCNILYVAKKTLYFSTISIHACINNDVNQRSAKVIHDSFFFQSVFTLVLPSLFGREVLEGL